MLNNFKTKFSITDLENLSGIKSHTIRIWERRYNLFLPERNVNKIREYSNEDLKKLLNIDFLINKGYKISKIAQQNDTQIFELVNKYLTQKESELIFVHQIKLSMLNFDSILFNQVFNQLLKNYTFSEVLYKILFPFLEHLGYLWQTNSINTAHEHFISQLIRQKIITETEKRQTINPTKNETFVLFLPYNEIHDISLLCMYYELIIRNKNVIYLGDNTEIDALIQLSKIKSNLKFLSVVTYSQDIIETKEYFISLFLKVLKPNNSNLFLFGPQRNVVEDNSNILKFNKLTDYVEKFEN